MAIEVKVAIDGLQRIRKAILNNAPLAREISQAWEIVYRSFVRLRFHKQSRGGGEWPALKPSTLRRRRKQGAGAAILRDTGALFASIQPTLSSGGLLQSEPRPLGFTIFLGGGGTYNNGPTLTEVATYHHEGGGRLPKREILVAPDRETIRKMSQHAHRILVKRVGQR